MARSTLAQADERAGEVGHDGAHRDDRVARDARLGELRAERERFARSNRQIDAGLKRCATSMRELTERGAA